MVKEQANVTAFMLAAQQHVPGTLHEPDTDTKELRLNLIDEELTELEEALFPMDNQYKPVLVADALADLIYVVLGTATACGIDIEPIFQEVHRSNMSKFIDGQRRDDGKWIKGPSYTPPNLQPLLDAQK